MSTTIDQRVVEMRFDNKQFESATQTTMSTLDKLKQSLNLTGASKGLENISSTAKNFNLSGVGSAVETVQAKFSALQIAGITALANITNQAVNAGKRIASALTIDPIKTGFAEYETQINAVQTILANTKSKGTTIDDVNGALDELNTYADKTIYNFTEMTRNIGTFTAAGVDLDKSVTSIKGIANLAAVSGSTSQQASTAMYQLSQALASGKVSLMDWNSVVNAGMGGQVFQDALKRTATNMGHNVDEMIKKYGSFRESLTQGEWLTADVLTETLTQLSGAYSEADLIAQGYTEKQAKEIVELAGTAEEAATKVKTFTQLWDTLKEAAQSGWTQSWEIIVGDFEEAKATLTKVSDVIGEMIGESAKTRNDLLQGWKDAGGREDLLAGFENAFDGIMNIVKPVKEAFREIFPPTTVDQLVKFTEGFKDLTGSFAKFTGEHAGQIKSTFKGIFSIVDIGVTFLKEFAGGVLTLVGSFKGLGGSILETTGSFGDWASNLRDTIKDTDIFGKAVDGIVGFLKKAIDGIKEFTGFLKGKLVMPGFEGFLVLMQGLWDIIQKVGSKVAEIGSAIGDALANAFRSGDISSGLDIINGGIFTAILLGIKKFVGGIADAFDDAGGMLEGVKEILDGVKGSLEAWQQNLKADTLLKLASAIGILALAIVVIATIDPKKLTASLGAITVLFADLVASMALLGKIGDIGGTIKLISSMIGISVAVLILASALKTISSLGLGELAIGLGGIFGLTAIIVAAAKVMSSESDYIIKGASQMILMSIALKILASACKDLSTLSWNELAKGLVGVGVLMAEISIFMRTAKFDGKTITAATGIVILAGAIKILASACSDFAMMKWEDIGKGLAAIGGLLAEMALFTKLTGNAKNVVSTGLSLVIIASSMKIFASAVKDFSGMGWEEIGRGLTAMAGALLEVTIAMRFMPSNMLGIGVGLVVVSSALIILSDALGRMSGMTWDEIGRGLGVLGGSMLILAIALKAMTGTLAGSAALLVAAIALNMFVPVLQNLGNMSVPEIAKGLITLAIAFGILGAAGYILTPLAPTILSLSASIALFGVSCLAIGVGIGLIAAGLTALSVAVSAGATAIVAGLTVIITGILGLIPVIVQRVGEALILLCQVIAQGAPAIGEALKAIVLTLVDILVECVPAIADGALKLIAGVLEALVSYTPQIVDSLFQFLIGLLDGIAENLPTLIQSAVNLLMSFLQGIVDALKGLDTTALVEGIFALGILAGLMTLLAGVAVLVPGAMIGVLGLGAVVAELAIVLAAIGVLAQMPGLSWLISEGGQLLQSVGTAIGQFVGGIVGGFMGGVSSQFPQIGSDLSGFMTNAQAFIEGAKNIDPAMMSGVQALADTILILTAANILDGIASFITGGSSLSDFGSQLGSLGTSINTFATNLGTFDESKVATVKCAVNAIKAMAEAANTIPNEGGWVAKIFGDNGIAAFGSKLPGLATNLNSFATNLGTFDEAKLATIKCASNAIKEMALAADSLPNEGGWAAKIFGDNSIATFGSKLPGLGTNLNTFATNLGTFDEAKLATIKCASNAIKAMAKAGSEIDGQAGWAKKLFGDNSLSAFGADMAKLGSHLNAFATNLGTFNESKVATVNSAVKAIKALAGLADADLKGAKKHMGDFGDKLGAFAKDISSFCKNMPESGSISSATTNIKKILSIIEEIANTDGDIADFSKSLKEIGTDGVDAFVKAFTSSSAKTNVKNAGVDLINKIVEGIKSKVSALKNACVNAVATAASSIRTNYTSFYSAGSYLAEGIVIGIRSKIPAIYAASYDAGKEGVRGAKKGVNANSPSKDGIKIGGWLGEGLVIGITSMGRKVYDAGHEMGDSAVKSLSSAMVRVNELLNDDIETQPTIKPVLDLSDVKSGANAISGMLNGRTSLGVLTNVGAISSMVNNRQNGANDDVVSAINKLRKGLDNVGNTTYNVGGITYDDGSNISNAVQSLVRAARVERRV